MSGSALAGLGSLGDYSSMGGRCGGSSSGGVDISALSESIQRAIEQGLASARDGKPSGGEGGRGEADKPRFCSFCGRKGCQMLSGGYPCQEANRAKKLLKEEKYRKEGKKEGKEGSSKGGGSEEGASK